MLQDAFKGVFKCRHGCQPVLGPKTILRASWSLLEGQAGKSGGLWEGKGRKNILEEVQGRHSAEYTGLMLDELKELMVNSRGERISPAQFAVRTVAYGLVGCFTLACMYAFVVLFFCM